MSITAYLAEKLLLAVKNEIALYEKANDSNNICHMLYDKLTKINSINEISPQVMKDFPIISGVFTSPDITIPSIVDMPCDFELYQQLQSLILLWLREGIKHNYNKMSILPFISCIDNYNEDLAFTDIDEEYFLNFKKNTDSQDLPTVYRKLSLLWWGDFVSEELLDAIGIKKRCLLLGRLQFAIDNFRHNLIYKEGISVIVWGEKLLSLTSDVLTEIQDQTRYPEFVVFCTGLQEEIQQVLMLHQQLNTASFN